ncbi:MAG: dehydratase [Desulfobacterales bacterium]|jgi:acyl dehydratase|nr:dehydratase [Desulfobacteraceae bacterium]MBT4362860.1 dehydratase [Desulfobacteraceae bacterium]MBT7085012.1 dehydratase [Desulfobacterales bacterium]
MKGKYFEEADVGEKHKSSGRTITESDIVLFAGLSGDYSPPHTDDEFCKTTPFKKKIAHGLLTTSISSGLFTRTGVFQGTGLAHMGTTIKYTAPVYIGDTLHIEFTVGEKEEMDAERGWLLINLETVNQDGKVVAKENMKMMIARKPTSS